MGKKVKHFAVFSGAYLLLMKYGTQVGLGIQPETKWATGKKELYLKNSK